MSRKWKIPKVRKALTLKHRNKIASEGVKWMGSGRGKAAERRSESNMDVKEQEIGSWAHLCYNRDRCVYIFKRLNPTLLKLRPKLKWSSKSSLVWLPLSGNFHCVIQTSVSSFNTLTLLCLNLFTLHISFFPFIFLLLFLGVIFWG